MKEYPPPVPIDPCAFLHAVAAGRAGASPLINKWTGEIRGERPKEAHGEWHKPHHEQTWHFVGSPETWHTDRADQIGFALWHGGDHRADLLALVFTGDNGRCWDDYLARHPNLQDRWPTYRLESLILRSTRRPARLPRQYIPNAAHPDDLASAARMTAVSPRVTNRITRAYHPDELANLFTAADRLGWGLGLQANIGLVVSRSTGEFSLSTRFHRSATHVSVPYDLLLGRTYRECDVALLHPDADRLKIRELSQGIGMAGYPVLGTVDLGNLDDNARARWLLFHRRQRIRRALAWLSDSGIDATVSTAASAFMPLPAFPPREVMIDIRTACRVINGTTLFGSAMFDIVTGSLGGLLERILHQNVVNWGDVAAGRYVIRQDIQQPVTNWFVHRERDANLLDALHAYDAESAGLMTLQQSSGGIGHRDWMAPFDPSDRGRRWRRTQQRLNENLFRAVCADRGVVLVDTPRRGFLRGRKRDPLT